MMLQYRLGDDHLMMMLFARINQSIMVAFGPNMPIVLLMPQLFDIMAYYFQIVNPRNEERITNTLVHLSAQQLLLIPKLILENVHEQLE
jgi:hypothetical protein